jgi:hypothetical protein
MFYEERLFIVDFFEFLRSDIFLLIILFISIALFLLYITTVINLKKLRNSYSKFMNKLGKGDNLDEMMREYIKKVENVEAKNGEIVEFCKVLDENLKNCTQKIGIVRYNAFKDTGSDLSFSLAILDAHNNGVVLNGIYARDCSNIYAKPVENGESKYVLSNEEKEAINKAINNIK